MKSNTAVEFINVSKSFGSNYANQDICFKVISGHIHALVGENGAGKSTAMKMLYGMQTPDQGNILIYGEKVYWTQSHQAINAGLGMVHQHFMLAEKYTGLENILLMTPHQLGLHIRPDQNVRNKALQLCQDLNFAIDLNKKVYDLPVGQQQQLELIKVLYQNAQIIILDEPTAVLSPQEIENLLQTLKNLKKMGKTILLITHKLKEVLSVADQVTVLRSGKSVGTYDCSALNQDQLVELMIGRKLNKTSQRPSFSVKEPVLSLSHITENKKNQQDSLNDLSLIVNKHEIVGIAALEGQGQNTLIKYIHQIFSNNIPSFPEDRLRFGVFAEENLLQNFMLGHQNSQTWRKWGLFLDFKKINSWCLSLIENFHILGASLNKPLKSLSGGNQQKLVVARELDKKSDFILASQPTRGVDVGSIEFIHEQLLQKRKQGHGILLISSELDELLTLSDRILVLRQGHIQKEFHRDEFNELAIGAAMLGRN
ncbi:MAG: ABC transporter ATP-binding protein [Pseudobdellovibrionaceae bacterium]